MNTAAAGQTRIVIRTPQGAIEERGVEGRTLSIGKDEACDIVIKGWSIGKRHAEISFDEDGPQVVSVNQVVGVNVNGRRIKSYGPLSSRDEIQVGGYSIYVVGGAGAKKSAAQDSPPPPLPDAAGAQGPHARPAPGGSREPAPRAVPAEAAPPGRPPMPGAAPLPAEAPPRAGAAKAPPQDIYLPWRIKVHDAVIALMDVRRTDITTMSDEELRAATNAMVYLALPDLGLPEEIDVGELARQVVAEAVGLGPLEPLLQDEAVTEVMVNAHNEIFIERAGRITRSEVTFSSPKAVLGAIERIVAPLGRKIDESSPMVDARLKDGSRVNAVIPPLALKGPCISIRKFPVRRLYGEDLLKFGSLSPQMLQFLSFAVEQAQNMIISGGTGSGKTTLLNVLSNFIPDTERIVTIEDAAELRLHQPNLVSLEARPANSEGKGGVPIRELVRNALRMRPDRIVVGECRGGEALDMLQAMNTGHDGSLTTAHANSARDMLSRVEVMVLMAGMDLPVTAIREQIASAVNLVVQQTRFKCGSRKITAITEVTGVESGTIQMQDLFVFKPEGFGEDGRVRGQFVATGAIPEFIEELRAAGIRTPPLSIFDAPDAHD
ncbi:ATPase, T2SS/T4P/T4SS family [Xenophilus sp. Marseille-Q4582]|uniref:ATPase, T2SS/T4P/T4SS family n=1 Tax=Xenophilus sp. Marseille-Q4582 TaxID=2866600 RepID=UPI001CE43027|nr:ATPase, T2SS/T4P/T4SS family [Xenophilus sp. Marseille-Q4582]